MRLREGIAEEYRANRITLLGAVSMRIGRTVVASLFPLTGSVAALVGPLFPLVFPDAAGMSSVPILYQDVECLSLGQRHRDDAGAALLAVSV